MEICRASSNSDRSHRTGEEPLSWIARHSSLPYAEALAAEGHRRVSLPLEDRSPRPTRIISAKCVTAMAVSYTGPPWALVIDLVCFPQGQRATAREATTTIAVVTAYRGCDGVKPSRTVARMTQKLSGHHVFG